MVAMLALIILVMKACCKINGLERLIDMHETLVRMRLLNACISTIKMALHITSQMNLQAIMMLGKRKRKFINFCGMAEIIHTSNALQSTDKVIGTCLYVQIKQVLEWCDCINLTIQAPDFFIYILAANFHVFQLNRPPYCEYHQLIILLRCVDQALPRGTHALF